MGRKYNLDKLIKIIVQDEADQIKYVYRKDRVKKPGFLKRIFGAKSKVVKGGIFETEDLIFSTSANPIKLPEECRLLESGEIVTKPRCILFFQDEHQLILWYETYEEALSTYKDITNDRKWIETK